MAHAPQVLQMRMQWVLPSCLLLSVVLGMANAAPQHEPPGQQRRSAESMVAENDTATESQYAGATEVDEKVWKEESWRI